ncbi:MAG: hypothetical protein AAFX99_33800, partial [Myxococcota bacterium]
QSDHPAEFGWPQWGGDLADLAERVPQCTPDCKGDACGTPRPIGSPLVVDLDGDGIQIDPHRTLAFDLADTGELVRVGSLKGSDALVVLDRNGNGRIDSGAELFGNNSVCGERRCFDGIEALAFFDANRDRVLDASDPIFARLLLWKDANADGFSSADELRPLTSASISSIELTPRHDLAWTDAHGNAAMSALSFHGPHGRQGVIHDVWFALSFNTMPSNPRTTGAISELALP